MTIHQQRLDMTVDMGLVDRKFSIEAFIAMLTISAYVEMDFEHGNFTFLNETYYFLYQETETGSSESMGTIKMLNFLSQLKVKYGVKYEVSRETAKVGTECVRQCQCFFADMTGDLYRNISKFVVF